MIIGRVIPTFLFACAVILPASAAEEAKSETPDKPRVLFVTQSEGFTHSSVRRKKSPELSPAEIAMENLAQKSKAFTVVTTQNVAADFTKENLQNYDVVMFYTTGKLPIAEEDLNYFLNEWLRQKGHGFIGVHSATDTYKSYKPYWDMIGGSFNGHPWTANSKVTLAIHDPSHPTMAPFGGESVEWTDEIYVYKNWQPEKVRVLMSLDMAKTEKKGPYHVPVAWVKEYGEGRVYYNNLGHREETWTKEPFLQSILAGIKWAAGQGEANATPNPELSKKLDAAAKKVATDE